MGINKSTGNMYDFVSHTFNTIKGKCYHDCSYCYCKKIANRFNKVQKPVRLDEKELNTNLGNGNFIFVGSSCDMFADNIPSAWILQTLQHCRKYDNSYLFQTKNPAKLLRYLEDLPEKSVICTTIETNRVYSDIMQRSPRPIERSIYMKEISKTFKTYVTIEPIMDFDVIKIVDLIKECNPEQVNIGADTGGNNLPEPSKEKILELISELEKITKVKQKSNLKRLLKAN